MFEKRCPSVSHFSSRKGNITLWVVFELITVATILVLLISTAYSKAEGQDIQLNFLAKDIALMVDIVHALPGDVILYYPFPEFTTDVTLEITNSSVSTESFGTKRAEFFFVPSRGISIGEQKRVIEKDSFFALPIIKQGTAVHFSETEQDSSHSLPVPQVSTAEHDLSTNQILFSADLGTERTGAFVQQMILLYNEQLSAEQAQEVSLGQGNDALNALSPSLFIGLRLKEQSNLSELTIHYGTDDQIKDRSQKIATLLYNSFTRAVYIDQARLSLEGDGGFPSEEVFRRIRSPRVMIEMSESTYQALDDRLIGELIGQVIATYYGS